MLHFPDTSGLYDGCYFTIDGVQFSSRQTVTVLSIITLFIRMQLMGRVDGKSELRRARQGVTG